MYEIVESTDRYKGRIFDVVTDLVKMPDGTVAPRDCVYKRGAVIVVPITDTGEVVLVRQYRHPVRQYLWELPAGLLDVDGEDPSGTAQRELMEETDLTADHVEHLIDVVLSPGFTDEKAHIFLARGLHPVPTENRHQREAEEADMQVKRVPLDMAIDMIFKGEIVNAASVAGLLAAKTRLT